MRIIFIGTPEFAVPCLKKLLDEKKDVVAVITRPDRKKGRGMKEIMSPVKQAAIENGLKIVQPESVRKPEVINEIRSLKPDIIIIVGYGEILKNEFLSVPEMGCINVHASLLPRYRGSAPIQWAIMNGDTETGVTIQYVREKLDSGDIILQKSTEITPEDNFLSVYKKLSYLGAEGLYEALQLIENKKDKPIIQKEPDAIYVPKIKKEDGLINWQESAAKINNRIRALNPWPGTYTFLDGLRLKILKAELDAHIPLSLQGKAGEIVLTEKERIGVCCGEGVTFLKEIQPESKKTMSPQEFISGYHVKIGMRFSSA